MAVSSVELGIIVDSSAIRAPTVFGIKGLTRGGSCVGVGGNTGDMMDNFVDDKIFGPK
jgi:hypothetical protein